VAPFIFSEDYFLPQAWTLSFELMFYLIFAVFFLLPRRAFLPALSVWLAAIVGMSMTCDDVPQTVASPLHPLVVEFILGCITGVLVRRKPRWCVPCLTVGVAGFVPSVAPLRSLRSVGSAHGGNVGVVRGRLNWSRSTHSLGRS
jgi:peptidoglycan/LPS O-acetylase OafA/YrhL